MYPNWNYWNWNYWNWKNWNKVISNVDTPGLSSPRPIKTNKSEAQDCALRGYRYVRTREHTQDALSSTRPSPESSEVRGDPMYVGGCKCTQRSLRTKNRECNTRCTKATLLSLRVQREAVRQIALLQIAVCMNLEQAHFFLPLPHGQPP